MRTTQLDRRPAWILFGALAAFYVAGRCPSFGAGLSPALVLASLGCPGPATEGYPILIALGRLASWFPIGAAAGNVNALSGLLHAATAALLFICLRRQGLAALPAAAAAGALGVWGPFRYYAQITDVWPLLNVSAALAACLVWRRDGEHGVPWVAFAIAVALGAFHHPLFLTILPALLTQAGRASRPGLRRAAAVGIVILTFPAIVRVWSAGREDLCFTKSLETCALVWDRRILLPTAWFDAGRRLVLALGEINPLVAALALLGAWRLRRSDRPALAFWGLWAASAPLAVLGTGPAGRPACGPEYMDTLAAARFLLPGIALFALAGHGAAAAAWLPRHALAGLLLAASAAAPALRPLSLRRHQPVLSYARAVLESAPPPAVLVVSSPETHAALKYLAFAEGLGRGRELVPMPEEPDWPAFIKAQGGLPVYAEAYSAQPLGRGLAGSSASGVLLMLQPPVEAAAAGLASRRAAGWDCFSSLRADDMRRYGPNPEIFLIPAYRNILKLHLRQASRDDAETSAALEARLSALGDSL